jgi:hypothetical protein
MFQNIPRNPSLVQNNLQNSFIQHSIAFTARPLPWCLDLLINHLDILKLGQNFSDYTALQQFMTGLS